MIFKIEDRTTKLVRVEVYEVEAETEQEAIDLYCNELAGSLEPIKEFDRLPFPKGSDDIVVV